MNAIALVVLIGAAIEVNHFTGAFIFVGTVVAVPVPDPGGGSAVVLTIYNFSRFAGDSSCLSAVALVVVEFVAIEINGGTIVGVCTIVAIAIGEPIRRSAVTSAICSFTGGAG